MKKPKNLNLTPRQSIYVDAYTNHESVTFGNAYQSAISAGYSIQTARNITHLQPELLSDVIGQIGVIIKPDEIMQQLTDVIRNNAEPTVIRLRATELAMRAYSMTIQKGEQTNATVNVNIDLTAGNEV